MMFVGSCSPCCGGGGGAFSCDNPPPHIRMTVNGAPRTINSGLSYGYAGRSAFDDNGAEYTMYRQQRVIPGGFDYYPPCSYVGGPHSNVNEIRVYGQLLWAWQVDFQNDRIVGYGWTFAPPSGASFRNLPYTDARPLVPLSSYYGDEFGDQSDWSNVTVAIDVGRSETNQLACPYAEQSACTEADIDAATTTACTSVSGGLSSPIADLPLSVRVTGSLSTVRTYSPYYPPPGYSEVTLSQPVNANFLNGDYDAAWTYNSTVSVPADSYYSFAGPAGSGRIAEGYKFLQQIPVNVYHAELIQGLPFVLSLSSVMVFVAIRPTAYRWDKNTTDNSAILTRCGDAEVSWGVHCVFLIGGLVLAQFYAPTQCTQYQCGGAPSFSVNGTVPIDIPANFSYTDVFLKGEVTVSVSSG